MCGRLNSFHWFVLSHFSNTFCSYLPEIVIKFIGPPKFFGRLLSVYGGEVSLTKPEGVVFSRKQPDSVESERIFVGIFQ